MISKEDMKVKYDLDESRKIYCMQILHAIPKVWKEKFLHLVAILLI